MNDDRVEAMLADLTDDPAPGDDWVAWLAARPQAAAELEVARRVRRVLTVLEDEAVAVPADFEARLRQRVRDEATLVALLDLALVQVGRTLLDLLDLVLALLPGAVDVPTPHAAT